jgi:hypothetical protein
VEIVVDFHLRPHYGDTDETDGPYYSEERPHFMPTQHCTPA